ncbi:DUF7146 domain-containing protein [Sphingomonas jatrophae]|uniref:Toprim domain-containing protein n=1 Tax=Sphingomonas jatrophae TaxID=1166337 RepID=A0A1I6K5Z2_9SPHN|nr:toprim domain-containing protein [Sphingomonas jatrophae]SFR86675.1 Toprim domain-containing protein [Sphingomonas jatrophae]
MNRAASHAPAIDVATIARGLNARAAELATWLLPNGRRSACRRWWETNNLSDTPTSDGGRSLKVELQGAHQGQWRDYANMAESGDMIDLVALRNHGGDKGAAIAWAKSYLGLDTMDPARIERVRYQAAQAAERDAQAAAKEREAKIRGARALWLNAPEAFEGTPAARYLEGRGIRAELLPEKRWPGSLRYHAEVWNVDAGVKLPCMVACLVTPDGAQVATHRTWLGRDPRTRGWVKADGAELGVPRGNAKKILGRSGGAFVPIAKGASGVSLGALKRPDTIYLTEGIEDALTVACAKPEARVGAAYSVGNIGAIEFPPLIERIVIVADRDDKIRAVEALERAIAKQQARGKHVQLVMPPVGFKDMNAWWQAALAERGSAAA